MYNNYYKDCYCFVLLRAGFKGEFKGLCPVTASYIIPTLIVNSGRVKTTVACE